MSHTPTHADLVARALGALAADEQARVDLALGADPALRRRYDEIASHLLRYDHLPATPAAPHFARLAQMLDKEDGTERPDLRVVALQNARPDAVGRGPGTWLALGAAAAAVLALAFWGPWRSPGGDATLSARSHGLRMVAGPGLLLTRDGGALPAPARADVPLRVGDRLSCRAPAEAHVSDRVRVVLDAGAVLAIVAANAEKPEDIATVRLEKGRAWFEVGPGPFRVELAESRGRWVEVLGTAFEIDLQADLATVSVAHGRVVVVDPTPDAGRTVLDAGWGMRGLGPQKLESPAGAWFQRPKLTLVNRGGWAMEKGVPFKLDLRFSNTGQVPVTLRGPGAIRTALWISFEGPNGQVIGERPVLPTHVKAGAQLLAPGATEDLQPGQSRVLSIEILPPLGSPGAYRCRALYRPEGQPAVLSAPLDLEVR